MARFNSGRGYASFGWLIATTNVGLQLYLLRQVWPLAIGPLKLGLVLVVAWFVTDFVNGIVHMIMDNYDDYESLAGPLIANFHLHHKSPRYRQNPLPVVYFLDSGSKIWLVGYLTMVALALPLLQGAPFLAWLLVSVGILSSVAEISHYLCHSSNSPLAGWLGNCNILLGKRHHARHHLHNNVSYAFLNGLTDPLIDPIARRLYPGYKTTTDLHYAAYTPPDLESR